MNKRRSDVKSVLLSLMLVIVMTAGSVTEAYAATYEGKDISHNSSSGKEYTWRSVMGLTHTTEDDRVVFNATVTHKNTTSGGSLGDIGKCTTAKLTRKIGSGTTSSIATYSGSSYQLNAGGSKQVISKEFYISRKCTERTAVIKGIITVNDKSAWKGTSTASSGSITIPALKKYTITYNANGGSGAPEKNSGKCSSCGSRDHTEHGGKSHGKSFILSSKVPTRSGFVFTEWNTKSDGSGKSYSEGDTYTLNANLVLYAQWSETRYTVRYDPNAYDATGTMKDQVLERDVAANLRTNKFIRPGYRLKGWSRTKSGSIISTDGGQVKNIGAGGSTVTLYAIWEAISTAQADIVVGKTVTTESTVTSFSFRIEAVEGWSNQNESTMKSGKRIKAADMPMPEGTTEGSTRKDISISGFGNDVDELRTKSVGLITYDSPGWYMYRIKELIPSSPATGLKYDRTSYYAVVYVDYIDDSSSKIQVKSITAWHNNSGSDKNRPDLSDIAENKDNGGKSALSNSKPGTYGKVGKGKNSLAVYKFWNSQETGAFHIIKNVRGSLGDRTKEFEFTATFTDLVPEVTYEISNDGAVFISGFDKGSSFTADEDGNAVLKFKLQDDEGFEFDGLPEGAKFEITESSSDHFPSYIVKAGSDKLKSEEKHKHTELSTGEVEVRSTDIYTVEYINRRSIVPVTGLSDASAMPAAAVSLMLIPCIAIVYLRSGRMGARLRSRNRR